MREHSRLRVETGLRSVSSRQGSRNIRDKSEHINLGRAVPDRLSDSRLVETTRYSVQVISSSMTCNTPKNRRSVYLMIKLIYQTAAVSSNYRYGVILLVSCRKGTSNQMIRCNLIFQVLSLNELNSVIFS